MKRFALSITLVMTTTASTSLAAELVLASRDNDNILRYDVPTGDYIGQFAVGGLLDRPVDVEVRDDNGNILVSNFDRPSNNAVVEYAPDGTFIRTLSDMSLEEVTATKVFGDRIYALANDTRRVGVFDDATGDFLSSFGGPSPTAPSINFPRDMEFNSQGELFISVELTNRIQVWDAQTGTFLRDFGSEIVISDGLTFGPDGLLYVSDFGDDTIKRFNPGTGAFVDVFTNIVDPTDLGFGPDGDLYVGSFTTRNIVKLDGSTGAFLDEVVPAFGPANTPGGFDFRVVPEPGSAAVLALSSLALLRRRRLASA